MSWRRKNRATRKYFVQMEATCKQLFIKAENSMLLQIDIHMNLTVNFHSLAFKLHVQPL